MRHHYNVNYSKLAILLLPTFLRKPILKAFLFAAMRPVESLQHKFLDYTNEVTEALDVKSQVCALESLLNDNYDYYERRIKVRNIEPDFDKYLLWKEGFQKPFIIYKDGFTIICKDGFQGSNDADFEVIFPTGYYLTENEKNKLIATINKHKLASKKYIIIYG